jgi:hypothetical protein
MRVYIIKPIKGPLQCGIALSHCEHIALRTHCAYMCYMCFDPCYMHYHVAHALYIIYGHVYFVSAVVKWYRRIPRKGF